LEPIAEAGWKGRFPARCIILHQVIQFIFSDPGYTVFAIPAQPLTTGAEFAVPVATAAATSDLLDTLLAIPAQPLTADT